MVKRSCLVDPGLKRADPEVLADIVVRNDLGAIWEGSRNAVGIDSIFVKPALVQYYHVGQVSAGRMPRDEDLVRASAAGCHFAERPGDSRSRIVNGLLYGGVRQEAVIDTDNPKAGVHQRFRYLLVAADQAAAVEPHHGREILKFRRIVEIKRAALPGIVPGILVIGNVLFDPVLTPVRALGEGQCRHEEAQNG